MKQLITRFLLLFIAFSFHIYIKAEPIIPHGNNCNTKLLELPAYTNNKGSQIRYYQSKGDVFYSTQKKNNKKSEKKTEEDFSLFKWIMDIISPETPGNNTPIQTFQQPAANDSKQPFFVLSFNTLYNIPDWVAWKLTREHSSGNLSRSAFDFIPDETFPSCPTTYDYNGVGSMKPKHARGHMCPAADNRWSKEAMHDCFYMTNMCPQSQFLNAGAWGSLEDKCRKWAKKYGEVYIACGPVIEKRMSRLSFNKKIGLPSKFFKVVMRKENNTYKAQGWIFTQDNKQKTMSVDEVERITGLNFFHNLPSHIEKKMEATYHPEDWK